MAEREKPNPKAPQPLASGGAMGSGAPGRAQGRSGGREFINYCDKWCSKAETVDYLLPGEAGRLNIAS